MRKLVLGILLLAALVSCGEKKKETTNEMDNVEQVNSNNKKPLDDKNQENSEFKKGADLIAANDCLGCHKLDEKLVGPSYKEVAAKYTTKDIEKLTDKIIGGGKGNWGEIPMTAHPNLNKEDATEMVKYVLSLK